MRLGRLHDDHFWFVGLSSSLHFLLGPRTEEPFLIALFTADDTVHGLVMLVYIRQFQGLLVGYNYLIHSSIRL